MTDRRTVLSLLGLASAGAIGTETFMAPPAKAGDIQSVNIAYEKERFAAAFEKIAQAIRADQMVVISLGIASELKPDNIADQHTLTFNFQHLPEV